MHRLSVPLFVSLMLVLPTTEQAAQARALQPADPATTTMLALGRIPPDIFDSTPSTSGSSESSSAATVRHCRVTSVHDGDSMRVRCPGFKDTLRIRLDQIDAPELDQAHGTRSRDRLRAMCPKGKPAVVHDLGADTYDRRLGRVFCNDVDVNAAMVKEGAAWVYDYHASDKSLHRLQDDARARKKGLWAGPKQPVAPWDFRHRQRRESGR